MTADIEYDTAPHNPKEVNELIEQLKENLSELARSICFAVAVKQYCYATKKEVSALDSATILKIRQRSDDVAEKLEKVDDWRNFPMQEVLAKAVDNELTRMINDGVIPKKNAHKFLPILGTVHKGHRSPA